MEADRIGNFKKIASIDQGSYGDIYLCVRD